MSSSLPFTGVGLALESVTVLNVGEVLRVRFTTDPKQSNANQSNDALNINNYTLNGPGFVGFQYATVVSGDPQSIDLRLASRIPSGDWTLTVANITTTGGSPLISPTTLPFTVSISMSNADVTPGAVNDDSEKLLRKLLNPALKGKNWSALIAGLATGDDAKKTNARNAFDQLFKTSAEGKYLENLASNDGVKKPKNIGLSDDKFRDFAIKTTTNKVVNEALLEVLEVFYGTDAVRAHAVTDNAEPYSLSDGDDLNITIDGKEKTTVIFNTSEFTQIAAAKAVEVAGAITRALRMNNSKAFALAFTDPQDGLNKVKIYSGSLGLKGTVQIKGSGGGKAQNALHFNDSISAIVYAGAHVPSISPDGGGTITLGIPCTYDSGVLVNPLKEPHTLFPQTQFLDKRIVVAGGGSYTFKTSGLPEAPTTAEMYNIDGTKTDLPNPPFPINDQEPAVTLGDGRILFVSDDFTFGTPNAVTIDPGTLLWTAQPAPTYNTRGACGVRLASGDALFIGCQDAFPTPGKKVLKYNQGSDTWSTKADAPQNLFNAQCILLNDGKVFVCGGFNDVGVYTTNGYVYDPIGDSWSTVSNTMTEGKITFGITKLGDGRILIAGGTDSSAAALDKVYHYNPTTDLFIPKGNLDSPKGYFKIENLANNYVIGFDQATFYTYNPNLDIWVLIGSTSLNWTNNFNIYLTGTCSILRLGGNVKQVDQLVGVTNNPTLAAEWILFPGSATNYPQVPDVAIGWTFTGNNMSVARCDSLGLTGGNGKHIVIGGQDTLDEHTPSVWYDNVDVIDPDGTAVNPGATAPYAAAHIKGVVLNDGTIFIAGGAINTTTGTAQAAIYDPVGNVWNSAASLHTALRDHTLTKLPSGKVLLVGGRKNDGTATNIVSLYDPGSDTWTAKASLQEARFGHITEVVGSGVFVTAGASGAASPVNTGEVNPFPEQLLSVWVHPASYGSGDVYVGFRPKSIKTLDDRVLICGGYSDLPDSGGIDLDTIVIISGPENENLLQVETPFTSMFFPRSGHQILPYPYTAITGDGFKPYTTPYGGSPPDLPGYFPIILAGDFGIMSAEIVDIISTVKYQREAVYNGGSGLEKGFVAFVSSDQHVIMAGGYNNDDFAAHSDIWKSDN